MKIELVLAIVLLGFLVLGCISPDKLGPTNGTPGSIVSTQNTTINTQNTTSASPSSTYIAYNSTRKYIVFTDPNEGAFSFEIPENWAVSNRSGLIRPYIDAGFLIETISPEDQDFFYYNPYGYIYTTPNQILTFAGFTEGKLYPTSSVSQPMMVMHYMTASEYAQVILKNVTTTNLKIIDRSDLANASSPLITRQSAAEVSYDYIKNQKPMKTYFLLQTGLLEISGTGIWTAIVSGYDTPIDLINETELAVLNIQRTFKVNQTWAQRETVEMRKRSQIISQSQNDIAGIISSTFETRSKSMDELNHKWDNYILGVEDVYDANTGEHYVVDSGSNYYWTDSSGKIYGTDVDESPLPDKNLQKLTGSPS